MYTRRPFPYLLLIIASSVRLSGQNIHLADPSRQDTIYDIFALDSVPQYPGGISKMMSFILQNVSLPQSAKDNAPAAKLRTEFTINADGHVCNVHVTKSTGSPAVDHAFMSAIDKMPAWKPGILRGKPVSCFFNLPINCILYK